MRSRVGLLVGSLVLGVTALVGTTTASVASSVDGEHAGEYQNPALNRDFPDPDVIKATDGRYYAYSTESDTTNGHRNIQVIMSRDLVHWTYLGDAMPELPAWGDKALVSWAPHVVEHDGTYFLYYSIVPDKLRNDFGLCLAVATSASPAGPFVTTDEPMYCGPTLSDIDSAVFHDPATGHWLMYWGSGGDIVVARVAANLTELAAPDDEPKLLLRGWSAPIHRPYEHGIEGPFVRLHNGWYYLFYSGNKCCSYPPHYATMVARSRSATGPFQRLAATRPGLSSVILHSNSRWKGPGHISVIGDEAGHDWLVYHAIDSQHPYQRGTDRQAVRRPMLYDRIVYVKGWPTIADDSPSTEWLPAPVTNR